MKFKTVPSVSKREGLPSVGYILYVDYSENPDTPYWHYVDRFTSQWLASDFAQAMAALEIEPPVEFEI